VADRRDAVATLRLKGVSKRRACQILRLGRSSLYYRPREDRDGALRQRLRELALDHPRYGYRRAWAMLRREGWSVNLKRVHRVWKELGLAVPGPVGVADESAAKIRCPSAPSAPAMSGHTTS
jgi:putative transposase